MYPQLYFDRIHFNQEIDIDAESLRLLHRAHMLHVPFENLDIHMHRHISLFVNDIFNKIVVRNRGGFCYEHNGLFAAVLGHLGFQVSRLEARVNDGNGNFPTPFGHMTLMVELDERWLVDVGFGDSFLEPLRLDDPEPQLRDGKCYRVRHDNRVGVMSEQDGDGEWQDQYLFFLQPYAMQNFEGGCKYHQTSPKSHFTQKRVCSLARPDGRITLSDLKFIETQNGSRREQSLAGEDEFTRYLDERFGIHLN